MDAAGEYEVQCRVRLQCLPVKPLPPSLMWWRLSCRTPGSRYINFIIIFRISFVDQQLANNQIQPTLLWQGWSQVASLSKVQKDSPPQVVLCKRESVEDFLHSGRWAQQQRKCHSVRAALDLGMLELLRVKSGKGVFALGGTYVTSAWKVLWKTDWDL